MQLWQYCLLVTARSLYMFQMLSMLHRNVDDYQSAPRNVSEVRTSRLQRGGSLKSLKTTRMSALENDICS
jgi:hypothetical protein